MRIPELGERYKTSFKITKEMVFKFREFSGDDNPIHVSTKGAYNYGFQKPICHGGILLSEISRIIGTELPGYGALWSDLNISFMSPVFWNETVDIELEVIQKSESVGVVKLKIQVMKENKKIMLGTAKAMCLKEIKRSSPMLEVDKRCALITGGSRGLGLNVTEELLSEGYNVVSLSRKESEGIKILSNRFPEKIKSICCDLNNSNELRTAISNVNRDFMPINIIVHAASPLPKKIGLGRNINEVLDEYINVYIKGLIEILDVCSKEMKKCKYGRIVNVGTSYILGTPPQSMYPYIIGKEALWGLTKSLANDLGRFGITANMVSPSMMITNMTDDISNNIKYNEAVKNPMNRLVEVSEVSRAILFLCGEGGAFINGINIPITGGGI